jgi:serine/threonine-protein kinase
VTPAHADAVAERYRVVRRLGAGGMATVFLAQDERLGRSVAIKRLHGESTDEVARRFRREARLGAALNHPNVVAVYDISSDDEGVLIVMEYVEGETLRDAISDAPLPHDRAIVVLRGVAAALDYAHENGVVHRDVKPANVLIRRDGTVKLADLGIATAAEHSKITRSGAVLGTAAYMAPERLDGRPGGPAVDVYALAAVAFETLSGRKAYEGTTPLEVAHKVVNEPTPDLRHVLPDAPDDLADAIKRGLAWEPDQRFAAAGELVAAIEAALPEAAASATALPIPAPDAIEPSPEDPAPEAPAHADPESEGTPARVLPPERIRTRPARTAAAAAPATTAPSEPERPTRAATSGRPQWPLVAAVLAAVALLVGVAIALGGGDDESPSGGSDQAERVTPGDQGSSEDEKGSGGSDEGSQDGGGSATPATPNTPDAGAAPAAGTPAAAVNDFYQRAARGDYQGAWALATPRAQQKLGGFDSFSAGQSSLETISFPKLSGKEKGDTATVKLQSEAVHSDRVDRCKGSVDLVRQGGDWRLDDFHIATCAKSPRP